MNIFQKFTLKSLKKNKTRTLVTIIGIILSAAMFSAVTTFVVSLQDYLLRSIIVSDGPWEGKVCSLPAGELEKLAENREVTDVMTLENIGYADLSESVNQYKPYLFVGGINPSFAEKMPVLIKEGRMPNDSSELILPAHLASNGGIRYQTGDQLDLSLGIRSRGEGALWQEIGLIPQGEETDGATETLTPLMKKTYTVVGFYDRPSFEKYTAPGYTALTVSDDGAGADSSYDVYFTLKTPKQIYRFLEDQFPSYETGVHTDLLRFSGNSNESSLNKVLYSLAGVLMGIIVFASIALIYNAFSISVSERTKQFGLLSSVGATRRQLMGSVLFESLILALIGIPLGLLSGFGGIAVTLRLTQGLFASGLTRGAAKTLSFHAVVTWEAMVLASAVCLLTILLSAYLPARRAARISAIEAIRQSSDIRIRPGKVKTSRLTYKLFGLEGMIASKNFKRNRKKYRATILSLFVSVVLFISASSFCAYLSRSSNDVVTARGYDLLYSFPGDGISLEKAGSLLHDISGIDTVTASGAFFFSGGTASIPRDAMTADKAFEEIFLKGEQKDPAELSNFYVFFVEDTVYEKFLTENGRSPTEYMDPEHPLALAIGRIRRFMNNQYHLYDAFVKDRFEGTLQLGLPPKDGLPEETTLSFRVGAVTQEYPYGLADYYASFPMLLFPQNALTHFGFSAEDLRGLNCEIMVSSSDHTDTEGKMTKIREDSRLPGEVIDFAAYGETSDNLILLARIFSTGFIVLISLIASANVFNTISTNVNLRRREFAMLKSMGMTRGGFNRMMNYECLLYGLKGLLLGIPVALGITYLIWLSLRNGIRLSFFVPIDSIMIASVSVFLVVFAAMLYSMSKVKKENTIDALRSETF